MQANQRTQRGASAIVLIVILAIIGTGGFIGLQYLPQYIESGTVDTILNSVEKATEKTPATSVKDIRIMIDKQLDMNQMDDLKDSFTVTQDGNKYIIKVNYERELDLLFKKKLMQYEKSLTLK